PVEPDGSAHFELPAMRSLVFVGLDEDDLSVIRAELWQTGRFCRALRLRRAPRSDKDARFCDRRVFCYVQHELRVRCHGNLLVLLETAPSISDVTSGRQSPIFPISGDWDGKGRMAGAW
ncbi:MAG: hypothetical protein ACE5JA_10305, partial [bacterium]